MIVDHSEETQKTSTNVARDGFEIANTDVGRLFTPIRIICKIDLSRLTRIPNEGNNFSINNNNEKSVDAEVNLMVKRDNIFD